MQDRDMLSASQWYCTTCGQGQLGEPECCCSCGSTEFLGIGLVADRPGTIRAATRIRTVESPHAAATTWGTDHSTDDYGDDGAE